MQRLYTHLDHNAGVQSYKIACMVALQHCDRYCCSPGHQQTRIPSGCIIDAHKVYVLQAWLTLLNWCTCFCCRADSLAAAQVFTMTQAAQVLIHSDVDSILAETILNCIAEQQGLPSKQSLLRSAHERLTMQDWNRFWQYTEAINPYIGLRCENVPIRAALTARRMGL